MQISILLPRVSRICRHVCHLVVTSRVLSKRRSIAVYDTYRGYPFPYQNDKDFLASVLVKQRTACCAREATAAAIRLSIV